MAFKNQEYNYQSVNILTKKRNRKTLNWIRENNN